MNKIVIGIDPGASGAICRVSSKTKTLIIHKCPKEEKDRPKILDFRLPSKINKSSEVVAYIEKVHAMPHDGRSSLFKFGVNYGVWLGALHSSEKVDKVIEVSPQKWMKWWENKIGEKLPRVKKDRKNKLKEIASVYTSKPATLWNADAVLIAMYGMYNELDN